MQETTTKVIGAEDVKKEYWMTVHLVIQVGAMLVAVVLTWANLDARTRSMVASVSDHEIRLRILDGTVAGAATRCTTML